MEGTNSRWIELAMLAAAAYAIYLVLEKVGSAAANAVASATDPLSTGAANAFVNLTSGPATVASGNVNLPDGTSVPVSSINPVSTGSGVTFNYGGSNYSIEPGTDSNGNWTAIPN